MSRYPLEKCGLSPGIRHELDVRDEQFVSDEVGWRFASLVDGEGCFDIRAKTGGCGCSLVLLMRADDRPLLERMRDELGGLGRIRVYPKRGNRQPTVVWAIHRRAEVLWLTELFDLYPLWSKKAKDYGVWREAAIAWYSGANDLTAYRDELRTGRAYQELVAA
jgi:hypothetical protein